MLNIWLKLKEKGIPQRLTIYVASSWAIIEVVAFFTSRYSWPDVIVDIAVTVLSSALPLYLIFLMVQRRTLRFVLASLNTILIFFLVYYAVAHHSSKTVLVAEVSDEKSIAVLPFANLSDDPKQEYFSDGIAEEILTALSQLKDLKVPGHVSSFQFKGKLIDLKEVGKKLMVSNVLTGSVRRQGDQLKITVQLVSVKNGYQLWTQQYDRQLNDVFAIQEEIAQAVIKKLKVSLLQSENLEGKAKPTLNSEAYEAVLKGRYFWNRRELKESEKYYLQAIQIDPNYAEAYAGLAETYVVFPFFGAGSPHESMPKAQQAAEKAIEEDSLLATPYLVIAFKNSSYDWDDAKAKMFFEKALLLNPNYAPTHYWYGHHLANYNFDFKQGIAEMKKSVELEPLGSIPYYNLGFSLRAAGLFKEGLEAEKNSIEFKTNGNAYYEMGLCYLGLKQNKEARKAFEQSARLNNERGLAGLVSFYMEVGDAKSAEEAWTSLLKRSESGYVSPLGMAMVASFLGMKDKAHLLFKKAFDERDVWLPTERNNRIRVPNDLMSDPRNLQLMEKYFGK